MAAIDLDYLRKAFVHFGEIAAETSPLYGALSPRVADEPALLGLAMHAQERQPPTNMLFGAVHFLLLDGRPHDLSAFYPSVGGTRSPDEAWPAFSDFCGSFRAEIIELIAGGRVQTNEIGRCGLLMPAFAMVCRRLERPVHLVEIGASAGLNMLFDRYRYEYGDGRACGDESPVVIRTEVRGPEPLELPVALPPVADRVGIDIAPVDVTDVRSLRWVEALIWPDNDDRIALHRAARDLARERPPRLLTGDGMDLVVDAVAEASDGAVPCVYHSHAIYQRPREWRAAFADRLDEIGQGRDLAHVSLEWLEDDSGPQLYVTTWHDGVPAATHVADCHHHGRWIRPLES